MKKQFFLLAFLFAVGGYSASAQTSTTTTKETTVTPASPSSTTPASTTTTESTTTAQPAITDAVVVPADAKIKSNRKKTKIKPKD